MKIAILGWGSLVWDPRSLKDHLEDDGKFVHGGPKLPIEFSRISKDGRLTLVIDEQHGTPVPTRVATSRLLGLLAARDDLQFREQTTKRHIGFTDRSGKQASFREYPNHQFAHDRITPWLQKSDFEAVVWTALPSNYKEKRKRDFSVEDAVNYLENLPEKSREEAFEYIRKAPAEVETPLRKRLRGRIAGERTEATAIKEHGDAQCT